MRACERALEALRVRFLPTISGRSQLVNETRWEKAERAFATGNAGETDIYFAAWQLMFDCFLYVHEYHNTREESPFKGLRRNKQIRK
ncbi:MAG: hypothetical protein GY757_14680 [bacterium]|nr:hypothetical protein [bacterium]